MRYVVDNNVVEEEDLFLDWPEFKQKYPAIPKEEYEMMVKQFQEV